MYTSSTQTQSLWHIWNWGAVLFLSKYNMNHFAWRPGCFARCSHNRYLRNRALLPNHWIQKSPFYSQWVFATLYAFKMAFLACPSNQLPAWIYCLKFDLRIVALKLWIFVHSWVLGIRRRRRKCFGILGVLLADFYQLMDENPWFGQIYLQIFIRSFCQGSSTFRIACIVEGLCTWSRGNLKYNHNALKSDSHFHKLFLSEFTRQFGLEFCGRCRGRLGSWGGVIRHVGILQHFCWGTFLLDRRLFGYRKGQRPRRELIWIERFHFWLDRILLSGHLY